MTTQLETIMTTKTKTPTKTKKHNLEATERLRKAASKEIGERLAKAEAADTSPAAAATPTPPATDGGKEPKKDKKAPGLAPAVVKLAKSSAGEGTAKQLGGLDAAAIVLKAANAPMNCKEIWAAVNAKKMWFTEGKTPEATIYSAILREIKAKGEDSRFKKAARGKFEFCGKEG